MRNITLIMCLLAATFQALAQNTRSERVYLSTDRSFYAAGETVYCSAFCLDEDNSLSTFSGVAYLELYSADGPAANSKIGLFGGRGAGSVVLPWNLPTGNYRLIAYTALDKNMEGFDYEELSHIISVYNTVSNARVRDGVKIVDKLPEAEQNAGFGPVSISIDQNGLPNLVCTSEGACIAVSIYKDAEIGYYSDKTTLAEAKTLTGSGSRIENSAVPEYDGEILHAKVSDYDGNPIPALSGTDIYIGCPGSNTDMYAASIGEDGSATFYTANIYGSKEMAVMLRENYSGWKVEFEPPFAKVKPSAIPVLEISESSAKEIESLGAAANISLAFDADTLYSRMPIRTLAFLGDECKKYSLDDYKRFGSMREVFTEIIGGISIRDGGIFVRCEDNFNQIPMFGSYPALVLLDGVPVLNHKLVMEYDAMQIKSIEVYPYEYTLGNTIYCGVVSFNTYKGMMEGFKFGDNVKIISFSGLSYPVSFSNKNFPANYPAVRYTQYWNPSVTLEGQKPFKADFERPQVPGTYIIKVEGLSSSGEPIFRLTRFQVK